MFSTKELPPFLKDSFLIPIREAMIQIHTKLIALPEEEPKRIILNKILSQLTNHIEQFNCQHKEIKPGTKEEVLLKIKLIVDFMLVIIRISDQDQEVLSKDRSMLTKACKATVHGTSVVGGTVLGLGGGILGIGAGTAAGYLLGGWAVNLYPTDSIKVICKFIESITLVITDLYTKLSELVEADKLSINMPTGFKFRWEHSKSNTAQEDSIPTLCFSLGTDRNLYCRYLNSPNDPNLNLNLSPYLNNEELAEMKISSFAQKIPKDPKLRAILQIVFIKARLEHQLKNELDEKDRLTLGKSA